MRIVLRTGTLTDGMKWKISVTASGAYKITALTGEANDYVLSVGWSLLDFLNIYLDGIDLYQNVYGEDTDYKDEWFITKWQHTVHLEVIYDHAYQTRYPSADARIESALNRMREKYIDEFGINIEFDTPALFESYSDAFCSADITDICEDYDETACRNSELQSTIWGGYYWNTYDAHHTNLYNVLARIPLPNQSESVKMAFLGHIQCVVEGDIHKSNNILGKTYPGAGIMEISDYNSLTDSECKTIIHEFGHLYDAPDHYGLGGPSTGDMNASVPGNKYNENCIYGENKNNPSVLSDMTICEGCRERILQNANRYNH